MMIKIEDSLGYATQNNQVSITNKFESIVTPNDGMIYRNIY
jgi:hypothetical protein